LKHIALIAYLNQACSKHDPSHKLGHLQVKCLPFLEDK
jgi:hypothetical protein